VSDFTSWTDLKTWLTSEAGGKLRVVEPRDSPYALVRYVKGQSNLDLEHVRWCRSVVVQKETRLPVSVAPPKSSAFEENTADVATVAEEFVDGTMINVFKVGDAEAQIATRSRLGGRTRFYERGPTFGEMFNDAMKQMGFEQLTDVLYKSDGGPRFTSTVLQHPANRIVKSIFQPSFVIVHQGTVAADGVVTMYEDAAQFVVAESESADVEVQAYKLPPIQAAKTVRDWVEQQAQERGFGWQGLVLKDGKGRRWRMWSDIYQTVRRFRGNESTNEERFARLRKSRSLDQYLSFFPEDRPVFYDLEGQLRKNSRQLFHFYSDVFRARKTAYHELPWPYKHHVSQLHNLFKDVLKAQGKKVDLEQVIRYVNGLTVEDTANMSKVHKLDLRPAKKPEAAAEVAAPESESQMETID
jgi:hypothetical protein